MRLTIVITILTMFQLSAATSFGQRITYVQKNVSIVELFKEIKKQTGYNIFWNESKLDLNKTINANFKDASLNEVLENSLKGMPISYSIVLQKKSISIKYEEPSFLDNIVRNFSAIDVRGTVVDDQGNPLSGATVRVKGANKSTATNETGEFYLQGVDENAVLVITYLGFESKEVKASGNLGPVALTVLSDDLEEVEVVSTGYQELPKERATGSFTLIDNKLLNRSVSPDILSRLNGVTNGLLNDAVQGISIRGRSTIFSNTRPLIVVDNFPFEGDINTINPNDVESVTILKDASAAAIWGTRAGNGVIVISTKRGEYSKPAAVTFNANVTVADKPNLYYQKQLSSSEFIDVEKFLFDKGAYTSTIDNGYQSISPVVAILQRQKLGLISLSDSQQEIDSYRKLDIRDQLDKYFYRPDIKQQYSFNVAGGGDKQSYFLSGGYDKNTNTVIGQSSERLTLKTSNSYKILKDKVIFSADVSFSNSNMKNNGNPPNPYLPYDQIADENGNALSVMPSSGGYRDSFTDTVGKGKLLDWRFRPLEELRNSYKPKTNNQIDYRVNLGVSYKIIESLSLLGNYQFYNASGIREEYYSEKSFYTRNIINKASYVDDLTGLLIRPIPMGGILNAANNKLKSQGGRVQLNFSKILDEDHEFTALGGYEIREEKSNSISNWLYGYIPERASSQPVDQTENFQNFFVPGLSGVSIGNQLFTVDRNISYYLNSSYGYKSKYIISGSFRKDESNLFGVKANQKGVPLWSTGLLWNVHRENFFDIEWLNAVALRGTYGYNGNINRNITAYLTAQQTGELNTYRQNFATIVTPPNDDLRWERVENINLGLDFSAFGNRVTGSFELFSKKGMDLIGTSPISPQSGLISFTGNVAQTKTRGFDLILNTINVDNTLKWRSTFIFNHAQDKVTSYQAYVGNNESIVSNFGINPIVGYPVASLFAYNSIGLNNQGNPVGLLNGLESTDYTGIRNSNNIGELKYFGSQVPTYYGSFRNQFTYKSFEISFNFTYKFGYFIRRNTLSYLSLYLGAWQQQPDFGKRWTTPGDESSTIIPSMIYPADSSRDSFYGSSSVLVENGSQIRLQDIQVNFKLTKNEIKKLPFSNLNIYAYATNLGLFWASSKELRDPDVRSNYPNPFSISFGLKTNF